MQQGLGWIPAPDSRHIELFGFSDVAPQPPKKVEKALPLPRYSDFYNQGDKNACVGFSSSWMMSILDRVRFDPFWLWTEAKKVDGDDRTNPGDNNGTTLRAAMDVLRQEGHVRVVRAQDKPPSLDFGIKENRWATSVDEVRTAISEGKPVVLGTHWWTNFDHPETVGGKRWIGRAADFGTIRGGHAICIYRASDKLGAVGIVNSWNNYPPVLMPYDTLSKLLADHGEATFVTKLRRNGN